MIKGEGCDCQSLVRDEQQNGNRLHYYIQLYYVAVSTMMTLYLTTDGQTDRQ